MTLKTDFAVAEDQDAAIKVYCATALCNERPASGLCYACPKWTSSVSWDEWQALIAANRVKIIAAFKERGSVNKAAVSLRMHYQAVKVVVRDAGLLPGVESKVGDELSTDVDDQASQVELALFDGAGELDNEKE